VLDRRLFRGSSFEAEENDYVEPEEDFYAVKDYELEPEQYAEDFADIEEFEE
jgi:hypothetical protein